MYAIALLLSFVLAQVTTGTISGAVTDSTGAVLPGATINLKSVEKGFSRTVTTDEGGRYRAPELALGSYEITAEVAGFQTVIRSGITLTDTTALARLANSRSLARSESDAWPTFMPIDGQIESPRSPLIVSVRPVFSLTAFAMSAL